MIFALESYGMSQVVSLILFEWERGKFDSCVIDPGLGKGPLTLSLSRKAGARGQEAAV